MTCHNVLFHRSINVMESLVDSSAVNMDGCPPAMNESKSGCATSPTLLISSDGVSNGTLVGGLRPFTGEYLVRHHSELACVPIIYLNPAVSIILCVCVSTAMLYGSLSCAFEWTTLNIV